MEIAYDYAGVPTLAKFAQSDAFIRGVMGAFGSGKSSACIAELVRRAQQQPRSIDGKRYSRWAVVRNTYPELMGTTIKSIFQWLPEAYFGRYMESKHTYQVKAFPGVDMEIVFLALDRPQDVSKLLSLELTGGWINEARQVPWSIVEALQGRVGRYPRRAEVVGGDYWHGLWMDTNPPDTDSSWYKFFEDEKWKADFLRLRREGVFPSTMPPEQYAAHFTQPSGRSPQAENLPNLPKGYYQKLSVGKAAEWIKVYVDGQYGFVVEGKLVYPEYGDKAHCISVDPIPDVPIIRSWDFGLTPACIFSQMLPDGRWLTFDEMTSDNMSIDQFSDEVLHHCTRSFRGDNVRFEDWGDPAGKQRVQTDKKTCFEIMQAKGIDIQASTQDPTLRQEAVRKTLRTLQAGEPQFILHPRCRMLRKGFMGGYHRRRMQTAGPERYAADPEKNNYSHCFPTGTLVSTPAGQVPIETLRVGCLVSTPLGPRQVLATMDRKARGLQTLKTRSATLVCTPNHPIWTAGSFVRADALQYGDVLWSEPWAADKSIPSSSSMASATTAGRRDITAPTRATTSIGMSGAFTTALFRLTTIFTTWMRIAETVRSRTSSAYPIATTRGFTASSAPDWILMVPALTWRRSGPRPLSGTDHQQAARGISNTLLTWLQGCPWRRMSAFAAVPTMKLSGARGNVAIAPRHAKRLLAERVASMTRTAAVPSATAHFGPIATARPPHAAGVVGASYDEAIEAVVYDLTVEEAHCFFANGLLVSNCHDALQYAMVQYFGAALTGDDAYDDDWPHGDRDEHIPRESTTGY